MGRIIEGLWDCKYCKAKGIGGSNRECPHCGKTRDKDIKFYLPNENSYKYVPEEKNETISRNPDWICNFCDCLNPSTTSVCLSCGSNRNSENLDYFENREKKEKLKPENNFVNSERQNVGSISENESTNEPEFTQIARDEVNTKSFWRKCLDVILGFFSKIGDFLSDSWPSIAVVLAVIFLIVGGIWLFSPKTENVTIEQITWERSIEIERYQTVNENGWSLPTEARLQYTKREIYSYQKVLDHYENRTRQVSKRRIDHYETKVVGHRDLGNGYFEEVTERVPVYETYYETEHYQEPIYRNEPVYKTKYYYEIDKWLHDRNLTTSGSGKSPYWADTSKLGSDERTAKRDEKYSIWYTNKKGKYKELTMPYNEWSQLAVGETITVKVSILGTGKLAD